MKRASYLDSNSSARSSSQSPSMSAGLSEFESAFEVNDDVVLLQSLWRTEFHAPELLPYQEELVESIKQLLDDQQVAL